MESRSDSQPVFSKQTVRGTGNQTARGNRNLVNRGNANHLVNGNHNRVFRDERQFTYIRVRNSYQTQSNWVLILLCLVFAFTTGATIAYLILFVLNSNEQGFNGGQGVFIPMNIDGAEADKSKSREDFWNTVFSDLTQASFPEDEFRQSMEIRPNSTLDWTAIFSESTENLSAEEILDRALESDSLFVDADDLMPEFEAEKRQNYELGLVYDRDLEKQQLRQFGQFDSLGRESLLLETLFLDLPDLQVQIDSLEYQNLLTATVVTNNSIFTGSQFNVAIDRIDRIEKNVFSLDPISKPSIAFLPTAIHRSNTELLSGDLDPSIGKIDDGDVVSIDLHAGVNSHDRRLKGEDNGAIAVKIQPLETYPVSEPSLILGVFSSIVMGCSILNRKRSR